jgi:hypothetical protein
MALLEAEGPPVNFDLWDLPETGDDFEPDITIDPNGRRRDTTDRQTKPGKPSPSGGPSKKECKDDICVDPTTKEFEKKIIKNKDEINWGKIPGGRDELDKHQNGYPTVELIRALKRFMDKIRFFRNSGIGLSGTMALSMQELLETNNHNLTELNKLMLREAWNRFKISSDAINNRTDFLYTWNGANQEYQTFRFDDSMSFFWMACHINDSIEARRTPFTFSFQYALSDALNNLQLE